MGAVVLRQKNFLDVAAAVQRGGVIYNREEPSKISVECLEQKVKNESLDTNHHVFLGMFLN